ncbi:apolipoprotein Bb, tandem duplicate 1 [Gadus chalcogrammus]|uniref:apolipoprotein Bb, tandem duplicate 1 n=1 Tax=Gadus chalcogrammus TaxID=1042646 RepID=UPI0024C4C6AF|nr:apolipoprotein Bb, tandem duplicate 1 [Gadus chalcogrammus]
MGESKLCILLLLSAAALASAQVDDLPTCLLDQRYKALHKYEYLYETESLNAINGASNLQNGPKASCKVEVEVPQSCYFIIRTTGCSLSEVVGTEADGSPVFAPASSSDAFAAEMEKYPLKVVSTGVYDVKLYSEEEETTSILNFKRGIISALLVPLVEDDKNKDMPTIYGQCKTKSTINERQTIATDITVSRDLSSCDKFVPMRDQTSSLALISGMHYPLAQLIRSSQTCQYKFDNDNKHMTSGSCTEKHILVPYSHKGEYGVTSIGKQVLTLQDVSAHNDRIFDFNEANEKSLHMEAVYDKSVHQDKEAGLALLRELATLPDTEGARRPNLFFRLVQMYRGMKAETLKSGITEALEVSVPLTFQVLAQCGTAECSSGIMHIFRTYDTSATEVDAAVFALGLVSNPSPLLIKDMLEMAQYKPSKPIMYALSNIVKRFYKAEGKVIPEITSVAEFMADQLGDCTGDKDKMFLILRVVGNMGAAMGASSPALKTAVIQCVNLPTADTSVQQAAIQVFRLTTVPEEGREVLMQVVLNSASPLQKRIAAYLVMMKDPQPSELAQLVASLPNDQDQQARSFVISHITNILSSTLPENKELREKILNALQGNEIGMIMDPTKFSGNYKMGSIQGNMIFEATSYLPKEVMLEMTLKAFGYDVDLMEIGMEGKGFEPTVEALFGENGFFPDTALRTMYFVSDNMPIGTTEMLRKMLPALRKDRKKRQASQGLMREIGRNLNKLVRELKAQKSPEAMVYLSLLGNELGYLKSEDMADMALSAAMMIDNMLKMFPSDMMMSLMTTTENEIFAHYLFMDNEFFLPTANGIPLRVALSGTFTPGIKGGLKFASDMSAVSFMPSAGLEFESQIGYHFPEYVNSGLEMHTTLYHESGLQAKISMGADSIKMSMPAPQGPTTVLSITNKLVSVTGAEFKTLPPTVTDKVDTNDCNVFFAGMKYCIAMQYTDAFSQKTSPYFPITGDSKFAVEIHPTGDVNEYTATIAYELLKEGEEGRQKVDAVTVTLRAEGDEPVEARATVKYNRRKNVLTTDIQVPDYDVEAGFRLGVADGSVKSKGTYAITLDLINKNVPQLSLLASANQKAMKEGVLKVQLIIPSIKADATLTAIMKRGEEMECELKSDIKFLESTSEQKLSLKYDGSRIEAGVESDMNSEIIKILPNADKIKEYVNAILDSSVMESDMKFRQILTKSVEATNNYMEKYASDIPYIMNIRIPDMPEMSLPEKLFLNTKAKAVYNFNNEYFTIAIPVPLGGKSTEELNFPAALTTPSLSMPQLGLQVPSMQIPIPELFVPETITISVPLFGKAEVSAMLRSNIYDLEASIAAGKDVVQTPSHSAMYDVKGTSPFDILSFRIEGSGMFTNQDSIKAEMKSTLAHKFLEASFNILEETLTDKAGVKSSSKIEAKSTLGLNVSISYIATVGMNTEEMSGDSNLEAMVKVGPLYGDMTSTQFIAFYPSRQEAKMDSSLKVDSTFVQAQNIFSAALNNGELSVTSNTNVFEDTLTHVAELSFKEQRLTLKSDTNALALGMKIRNEAQGSVGAGVVLFRVETNADRFENRFYCLQTGTLDINGLVYSSEGNAKLLENEATHTATLKMSKDGLETSGKSTLKSPLMLENNFRAGLDAARASLFINNKAILSDKKFDNANTLTVTPSSFDFNSNVEIIVSENVLYTQDITIDLKPYIASSSMNNNLKVLGANLVSEAQLKAELYKMDLSGSMKAIYDEQEIKHTYEVNYADLAANAKCSTSGKLFGTQMSHNTELEVVGLAAKFLNDARFNSQPMRFDHNVRASVVPFDFNLDTVFNADGDLALYGMPSAQIYFKNLLRAQPLVFVSSHEYRASVNQKMDNGFSSETTIDYKIDTLLSPQVQEAKYRLKSKLNDHAYNEDFNMFNNADRIGVEVSSTVFSNAFNMDNTENQEFTITIFLKYDKNTNSQLIQIPYIDVAAYLENIKVVCVNLLEAFRSYANNEEIAARLGALPQSVSDFVKTLSIEDKTIYLKQYLTDFTKDYSISMEDLEAYLTQVTEFVTKRLSDLGSSLQTFFVMVKELIVSGTLSETLIQNIEQKLVELNDIFDIKILVVAVMDNIIEFIAQIDLEKLQGSSMAYLQDIDAKFEIKSTLEMVVRDLKQYFETFDLSQCVANIKSYISSIDFEAQIMDLIARFPTEIFSEITRDVRDIVQELQILEKVNAFHAKIRDIMVKMEIDQKMMAIMEQILVLIQKLQIDETVQAVMKKLERIPQNILFLVELGTSYVKDNHIMEIIGKNFRALNAIIRDFVQMLNTIEYSEYVAGANRMKSFFTSQVNRMIRELELSQKLDATVEFINFVISSIQGSLEQLREIKFSEMAKTVLIQLKEIPEFLKQGIDGINVEAVLTPYLRFVSKYYSKVVTIFTDIWTNMFEVIQNVFAEQMIISEVKQMIEGVVTGLKTAELEVPSFTFPGTDLVVPSMKISMDNLYEIKTSTQLEIPQFTIMGLYTIPASTISFEEIKQRIIELINYTVNFEFNMLSLDDVFGDISMNYFPVMPQFTIPQISLAELSFPEIPVMDVDKLVKTLQIPDLELPAIPSELMLPCFGKVYGEMKIHTPIYTIKTTAELANTTDNALNPRFSGIFISEGKSPKSDNLNFIVELSANIAIPKRSRVVVAEALKLTHLAFEVEHQGSANFYGRSAQAQSQAQTTVKVMTTPYTANLINKASLSLARGITVSIETKYDHMVNLPSIDFTSDIVVNQQGTIEQEDFTIKVKNIGSVQDRGDNIYKTNMLMNIDPRLVKMSFSADTITAMLKSKQQMTAESALFQHIKFNIRNEAEGPAVKNSLFVASGQCTLNDLKIEFKANHDAELYGLVDGVFSNAINFMIRPTEFVFDFQNKGNAKVNFFEALIAKIELQNDYSAMFNAGSQQMNTMALARINQYKVLYNFTVNNNDKEAAMSAAIDSVIDLGFMDTPISIPEFPLLFAAFDTPAITNLNLYEQSGLKDILTTTEQNINVDAKIVYEKSQEMPIYSFTELIRIPSAGNLVSELSVKSAIINLNIISGLSTSDDLVIRIGATSNSVFESLKAKLDGTSSLTIVRGIKLANSLSLENQHIIVNHESSIGMKIETFETKMSVTTNGRINTPILNLIVTQSLVADSKVSAHSTFQMKGDFNVPKIEASGNVEADHSLKFEGSFKQISIESTTKANIDGRALEQYVILGILDNDANLYLNEEGLRSTSKLIADYKLNSDSTKVIGMDVNENASIEASLSRVLAVLKCTSNNEVNMPAFNTKGKYVAQATMDLTPISSLADMEINLSQQSSLGDLTLFEKIAMDITGTKQKMYHSAKLVTPVITTMLESEVQGEAPVFKVTLKSSATSPIVFLEYDMDASSTTNFENEALMMTNKAVLTHTDVTMDVNHVITQALRRKRQVDGSISRQTLNVDITSSTFTDANFRYAAGRDAISASVSTPSTGFLGLQVNTRLPSLSARLYSRYASAPEIDVDVLVIRTSPKGDDKMTLQVAYNMDAPAVMLSALRDRLASITSAFTMFAEKYQITMYAQKLMTAVTTFVGETYDFATNYDMDVSQLSTFFRNVISLYQKTVQASLDAAVKVLTETRFKLSDSEEMTTLPEVLKRLTSSIGAMLERAMQIINRETEVYINSLAETMSAVEFRFGNGDPMTGAQVINIIQTNFKSASDMVVDFVKNMESLDKVLEMIRDTTQVVITKSQEFVDSIKSDYLDAVLNITNNLYRYLVTVMKDLSDRMALINMDSFNSTLEYVIEMMINVATQFQRSISDILQQASEETKAYMKVSDRRLELDLPFSFTQ